MTLPKMEAPPSDKQTRPSFDDQVKKYASWSWEEVDPIHFPGASIRSFAEDRFVHPDVLMMFNFGTRDPKEVNWWLGQLGCTETTDSGNNYTFEGWSGVFWVPVATSYASDDPLEVAPAESGLVDKVTVTIPVKWPPAKPPGVPDPPKESGRLAYRIELVGKIKLTFPSDQAGLLQLGGNLTNGTVQAEVSKKVVEDLELGVTGKLDPLEVKDAWKGMKQAFEELDQSNLPPADIAAGKKKLKKTFLKALVPDIEVAAKSEVQSLFGTDAAIEFQTAFDLSEAQTPFSVQAELKGGAVQFSKLKPHLPSQFAALSNVQAEVTLTITLKVGPSKKVLMDAYKRLGGSLVELSAVEFGAVFATLAVVYGLVGFSAYAQQSLEDRFHKEAAWGAYKASYVATVFGGRAPKAWGSDDLLVDTQDAITAGRQDAEIDAIDFFGDTESPMKTYRAWAVSFHDKAGAKAMLNFILEKRREQSQSGSITYEGAGAAEYLEHQQKARNGWQPGRLFENPEGGESAMRNNIRERLFETQP